jgi:NAD-dependent SIR2 family protein deacetylase
MTARPDLRAPDVTRAAALLRGRRIAVLTGAGCSTESGIPDYRGAGTPARARSPIRGRDLARDPMARRRYWARSMLGWERFAAAAPNAAHRALKDLETAGAITGLVTQNVDRLHHAAGSRRVIELHGALAEVRCIDCDAREPRADVQRRLRAHNPGFEDRVRRVRDVRAAPDGDAELPPDVHAEFVLPTCIGCGGDRLRPDVVLFDETVARPVVDAAFATVEEAEALLVVGTSLTVYSGLRFVRRAAERATPVVIVNLGPTRGDALASLRIDSPAGRALPALAAAITAGAD